MVAIQQVKWWLSSKSNGGYLARSFRGDVGQRTEDSSQTRGISSSVHHDCDSQWHFHTHLKIAVRVRGSCSTANIIICEAVHLESVTPQVTYVSEHHKFNFFLLNKIIKPSGDDSQIGPISQLPSPSSELSPESSWLWWSPSAPPCWAFSSLPLLLPHPTDSSYPMHQRSVFFSLRQVPLQSAPGPQSLCITLSRFCPMSYCARRLLFVGELTTIR